jgi:putative transposase
MDELIEYACSYGITGFMDLYYAKYRELRQRYPTLPSQYIQCACRHAASIYKSFIKLKKLRMCEKEKPMFKAQVILLDHHLFKLDAESWKASIMLHDGR